MTDNDRIEKILAGLLEISKINEEVIKAGIIDDETQAWVKMKVDEIVEVGTFPMTTFTIEAFLAGIGYAMGGFEVAGDKAPFLFALTASELARRLLEGEIE